MVKEIFNVEFSVQIFYIVGSSAVLLHCANCLEACGKKDRKYIALPGLEIDSPSLWKVLTQTIFKHIP